MRERELRNVRITPCAESPSLVPGSHAITSLREQFDFLASLKISSISPNWRWRVVLIVRLKHAIRSTRIISSFPRSALLFLAVYFFWEKAKTAEISVFSPLYGALRVIPSVFLGYTPINSIITTLKVNELSIEPHIAIGATDGIIAPLGTFSRFAELEYQPRQQLFVPCS